MVNNPLFSISPIDGRYSQITKPLQPYFSEYGLIYYRTFVEIKYVIQLLSYLKIVENINTIPILEKIIDDFSPNEAQKIKNIEKTTNHDIKAIEYYLHNVCETNNIKYVIPYIHFGLTSQDINNTAIPMLLKDYMNDIYKKRICSITTIIDKYAHQYKDVPMLCHTHGQPASPSTFGKECKVFLYRLEKQIKQLENIQYWAKFGGATGNFNAHVVAYSSNNWIQFANEFIQTLGLKRNQYTTQIDNYENLSTLFDNIVRINTILVDFCRDIWSYISMDYIQYKVVQNEVGSSTMPHKVNPIQFENAEGNLLMANAMFTFFSQKLPVSRLQRDLTDSTVLRNIGTAFGHVEIAFCNIIKGLQKIDINRTRIKECIEDNWIILGEALQTILRKHNYPNPYEVVKDFSRNKKSITKKEFFEFVDSLEINDLIKEELKELTPSSYIGYGNMVSLEPLE
jgi:adenylosuccinate lyase